MWGSKPHERWRHRSPGASGPSGAESLPRTRCAGTEFCPAALRSLVPRSLPEAHPQGFTLVEAAVAIAVVAILSGMLTPLAVRVINQQREIRTRENLKTAFEGMFGARDRRVANMRGDFGFGPSSSRSDLACLVLSSSAGTSLPSYGLNGMSFFYGWNGPYWQGSLDASNRPVDGWGKPLRLVYSAGPPATWQVQSGGGDLSFGTADDLAYPATAAAVISYNATLILNINKSSGYNYTGNAVLSFLNGSNTLSTATTAITNTAGLQTITWNACAGGMQVNLTKSTGTFINQVLVMDLMPGEVRTVDVTI